MTEPDAYRDADGTVYLNYRKRDSVSWVGRYDANSNPDPDSSAVPLWLTEAPDPAVIAAVLAKHLFTLYPNEIACDCEWVERVDEWSRENDAAMIARHVAHVAAALAPLLAARVATAKADALREAARAWTWSEWSDVMLPKPTPPAVPAIAYSNRVGDWLRTRADRLGGAR